MMLLLECFLRLSLRLFQDAHVWVGAVMTAGHYAALLFHLSVSNGCQGSQCLLYKH